MKNSKVAIVLLLFSVLFLFVSSATLNAKTKVSGKMTAKIAKQEKAEVGDMEGHMVQFHVSQGTNAGDEMGGAQFENCSFSDTQKGNGTQIGYTTFTLNDNKWTVKFEGEITTTMSEEGKPNTSFEGTFTFTNGEGKYKNIKGGGTYKGKYISETEWEADWEGSYDIGM
jgi:hypothetical protein